MSFKALWLKEYHQARWLMGAMLVTVPLYIALTVMRQLEFVDLIVREGRPFGPPGPPYSIDVGLPTFIIPVFLIALAAVQIGAERGRGLDHFTFSLPYARSTVFVTKWALGVVTIVVTLLVSALVASFLLASSPYRADIVITPDPGRYALQMLAASLAMYTLAMFMGVIAGNAAFQVAFSVIFGIFPLGFVLLVGYSLVVHADAFGVELWNIDPLETWGEWSVETLAPHLSVLLHFSNPPATALGFMAWSFTSDWAEIGTLAAVDFMLTALFLVGGVWLYGRNRLEYDGLMLVFPGARPLFIVGITGNFALLGGLIAAFGSADRYIDRYMGGARLLISYYVGALILGGLAYFFTKRFLRRPVAFPRKN
ncbi:MAG: hypothetical protein IMW86_01350 [Hydrogenibacillus sp.]|nr:hypothetical protein [Hydrogenibacillus sp.]